MSLLGISSIASYAALLFGSGPESLQSQGLFMLLVGTVVVGIVGAWRWSVPTAVVQLDSETAVIAAGAIGSASLAMSGATAETVAATVTTGLAIAALFTGLVMVALGRGRGAAAARFVPLQVTAGVIAASGYATMVGGLKVATGQAFGFRMFADPGAVVQIAPVVIGGAILLLVRERIRSPWVLPNLIIAALVSHHAVFAALGWSITRQQQAGWLVSPVQRMTYSIPWSPDVLRHVDWSVLGTQTPALAAIVTVGCLILLINATVLELAFDQDGAVDSDLGAAGTANLAAGLMGGMLGSISLSRSLMLNRFGIRHRSGPVAVAAIAGLLPMAVPQMFGLIPRWVLGALLLSIGLGALLTWLVRIRTKLTTIEYLAVPAVVAVAVQFGLPAAVFTGLALGCATFAVLYSRGSPIRARFRGDVAQSNVDRTPAEQAVLREQADALLVLYLQGYLFFGTASKLLQEIKAEIAQSGGRLRHIVLDCSNLDNVDGTASDNLARIRQIAVKQGIVLYVCAVPDAARARLGRLLRDASLRVTATLDAALEQVETVLLAQHPPPPLVSLIALLAEEFTDATDAAALERVLIPGTLAAGAILMRQHEASDHLVFIEDGLVDVLASFNNGPEVRVRRFGPGTMVGEIGFLLNAPRTATIRAETPCRIWTLTRAAVQQLETERPGAALALQRAVMRRLSRRLLDKDQLIGALLRGSKAEA